MLVSRRSHTSLWNGELPNQSQLDELNAEFRAARVVHADIIDHLRHHTPKDAVPMSALRTALSMLGLYDDEAEDMSPEANMRKAMRITAKMPTIVAAFDRIRRGLDPVAPKQEGSMAFDFLYMLNGEEPGPAARSHHGCGACSPCRARPGTPRRLRHVLLALRFLTCTRPRQRRWAH